MKKNQHFVPQKSSSTEKTHVIKIRVTDREYRAIELLAALVHSDISNTVRACVRQSGGVVRRRHLANFLRTVAAMPDPFDTTIADNPYCAPPAAACVDDADREIADIDPVPPLSRLQRTQAVLEADLRLDRILWLIDSPDSEIPPAWLADVQYWRSHYNALMRLHRAGQQAPALPNPTPSQG